MVVILQQHIQPDTKEHVRTFLLEHGYQVKEIVGDEETIFGAVGPARLDIRDVEVLPGVARVIPISKPYKLASRELQERDSVVTVGPVRIGGGRIVVIGGPCAVESREQIIESAAQAREAGAVMLRGGAYKPRTSPYSFQGLGRDGLAYLKEAGERYGLPVVSEIVSSDQLEVMRDFVDMLQIGARNMQNFELLKAVGASGIPVMLKRGLAARIEEWLMAAEYLMAHGNESVVLCERGIRSFETYTRNSLDLSSIPVVKKLSHLPVIVDPSHATGIREKVVPMAMASIAAGADGIMVEMHPDPDNARSDGAQSLYPSQFEKLVRDIQALCPVLHKELFHLPVLQKASDSSNQAGTAGDPEAGGDSPPRVAFQGASRGVQRDGPFQVLFPGRPAL
jgi:3-deoxy-7-phosphoheptulonate synthase